MEAVYYNSRTLNLLSYSNINANCNQKKYLWQLPNQIYADELKCDDKNSKIFRFFTFFFYVTGPATGSSRNLGLLCNNCMLAINAILYQVRV